VTTSENSTTTVKSVFLPVGYVDIEATLDGGQAFRWWPEETGGYRGVVGRRVVNVDEIDGSAALRTSRSDARCDDH